MANENRISGSVGLDITNFKANVNELNRQIKVIESSYRAAADGTSEWGKTQEGLEARIKALSSVYDVQSKKIENLKAEYKRIVEAHGESSVAAQNLQIKINNETAALNKNQAELQLARTALEEFNRKSYDTSSIIADGKTKIELYQSQLRAANTHTKDWAASQEGLKEKIKALTGITDTQRDVVKKLEENYRQAAKQFGENSDEAIKLKIELNNETAALNQNKAELDDAQGELKDYGKETEEAKEKTGKFGDAMAALGKAAAAAMAAVAAAGAAAVAALVKTSISAADAADEINTLSAQTGLSADKIQEMQFASKLLDVSLETITGSMTKNIRSMKDYQDGTAETVDAYEKLGVAVLNTDGSLRNGEDVYWEMIDALSAMDNETERDALSMQLLGRSARDLNPLIKAGSGRLKELAQQAHETGYVMSEETLSSMNELQDNLDYMSNAATAAKNALGTVLMPMLKTLAKDGTDLLGEFASGIKDANGDIGKVGEAVGGALRSVVNKIIERLPEIITVGKAIVTSLISAIVSNLPQILDAAIEIMKMLVDGMVQYLPELVDVALKLVVQLATALVSYIPELIPAAVAMVLGIVQALLDNLPMLLDVAIDLVLAVAQGIINALPVILESAPKIIKSLIEGIVSAIPQLIDAAVSIVLMLVQYLTDPNNIVLLVMAAVDIMLALALGLVQNIDKLIAAIPQIFTALVNAFLTLDWKSIGNNIIQGLIEGVKNSGQAFIDAIVNIGKDAWKDFKKFWGINSPATRMISTAEFIGEGAAIGLKDSIPKVKSAMNSINSAIQLNPITAPVESRIVAVDGVSVSAPRGGGVSVNLTQHFNSPKAINAHDAYLYSRRSARDLAAKLEEINA